MRRFLPLCLLAVAACETTPDAADERSPTVSVKHVGSTMRTILSTVPDETVDRVACPPGTKPIGLGLDSGFGHHIVRGYPAKFLVFVDDDSGVRRVEISTPNGTHTKLAPKDIDIRKKVGGRGSTAYDRLIVDNANGTPRSPQLVGFDFTRDADAEQNLYFFGPVTDFKGNSERLGAALVIGTVEEVCEKA